MSLSNSDIDALRMEFASKKDIDKLMAVLPEAIGKLLAEKVFGVLKIVHDEFATKEDLQKEIDKLIALRDEK